MTHLKLTLVTIFLSWLPVTVHSVSIAQVYCGLPDGSHWYWLYDQNGDHETISGNWKKVMLDDVRYYKALEVSEESFTQKNYRCEEGYAPQPEESFSRTWEVFKVRRPDNTSYIVEAHKSYHANNSVQDHYFRSL